MKSLEDFPDFGKNFKDLKEHVEDDARERFVRERVNAFRKTNEKATPECLKNLCPPVISPISSKISMIPKDCTITFQGTYPIPEAKLTNRSRTKEWTQAKTWNHRVTWGLLANRDWARGGTGES